MRIAKLKRKFKLFPNPEWKVSICGSTICGPLL